MKQENRGNRGEGPIGAERVKQSAAECWERKRRRESSRGCGASFHTTTATTPPQTCLPTGLPMWLSISARADGDGDGNGADIPNPSLAFLKPREPQMGNTRVDVLTTAAGLKNTHLRLTEGTMTGLFMLSKSLFILKYLEKLGSSHHESCPGASYIYISFI